MSLSCPRCEAPLDPRTAAPRPGAPAITAGVCTLCGGIWLDGDTLAAVSPALGDLPARRAELAAAPGRSPVTCPRCREGAVPAELGGVSIDVCPTCAGVWLDAGEYEAVVAARPAPGLESGAVRCARCGATRPQSETYVTEAGPVCAACNAAAEVHAQEERALRSEQEDAREAGVAGVLWDFVTSAIAGDLDRNRR